MLPALLYVFVFLFHFLFPSPSLSTKKKGLNRKLLWLDIIKIHFRAIVTPAGVWEGWYRLQGRLKLNRT